jgi:hypothetical protein
MNRQRTLLPLLAGCALFAPRARAQSEYHNTDTGRPLRVEDALATERHSFELQLAPARVERVDGGSYRARVEPKLSYGILPRAQIEVRVPVTYRQGQEPRFGLAGVGVGGLLNFNAERTYLPAFAVAMDVLFPAGSAAAMDQTAITMKGIVTRSFAMGRLHLNGTYSTFKAKAPGNQPPIGCDPATNPSCQEVPWVPDDPCFSVSASLATSSPARGASLARSCAPRGAASSAAVVPPPSAQYWLLGIAGDRALALRSVLLSADVFAERSGGAGRPVDWTAEVGARHQITPQLTADVGLGHRFAGSVRSWFVGFGTTYSFAIRALIPEAR